MKRLSWLALFFFLPPTASAWDGKWTPQQVLQIDPQFLRAQGLKIPPSRLWEAKRGTGLLAGAVDVSGCSGAFVSKEGLVATNHHCVFPMVQEHSTPARNLIENGFLARSRGEELPGKGARVYAPRRFTDVTKDVEAAIPAGADDLARFRAIDRKTKELVKECEAKPATRCNVGSFSGGLEYILIETMEILDVRLVYAPPRGVGEFGGEVDNWSWPRHTGDFGLVRAYVGKDGKSAPYSPENVPLQPEFYFPLSSEGVKPGDFVMVLGYPGFTVRELLADEMELRATRFFPRVIDVYGEIIGILEGVTDSEGKLAVASQLKSLQNRTKNAEGQLAGLARGKILEKKRAEEAAILAFLEKKGNKAAIEARAGLLAEAAEASKTWEREFLLDAVLRSSRALYIAATVARLSTEREKPDLDRDPIFMEREMPRLKESLEREQRNIFVPSDKLLFAAWVKRALALGPAERIAAVDKYFGAKATAAEVGKKVDTLYAGTKLLGLEGRMSAFGAKPSELKARKDPLLDFGFELAAELDALKLTRDRRNGAVTRLRPNWRRGVLAHAGKPVAPDANSTLRVTFAHVQGYSPKDGVLYTPQTTLSGMIAKHTGREPFNVPEKVRTAATAGKLGRWADKKLKDVPICFLADADTTGGNSGSPVVDGQGRLVGINFDRVWENVANDFGFNPDVARNISADVRYMLWQLEQVEGATALLAELGVRASK